MADSTSKRPQDDQGGPPQKKPRLYDRLESSSFTEKTAEEVAQYFENKGYHTLKEATAGMKGDDVIANFRDFQQNHPGEVNQWADSVDSDPLFQPNLVAEKKVFSTNTTILRDSGYFYVSRRSTATLGRVIKKERREGQGNYILIHGPRASGKTTLMRQIISNLDPDRFEWGLLQLSEREKDWNGVMIDLANNQAATTEGCRQAAQNYLDMDMEKRPGNALKHLFRHNYGGKKLILFWDEFDNAYAPERKFLVGPDLREVQDLVIPGELPGFQAIAFFGSYNANLVTSMGGSQFTFNTIHSHETVDFTLDETKDLFGQYQQEYKEYKVEVSPEVIEDIHKLTGGHAGLTNLCGDVILKSQMLDKAPFTMERWRSAFSKVVDRVFVSQTYKNMLQALNRTENPEKTKELLRALCYSSGHDAATNESEALQNLGFAKKEPDGLLYIKSQLIKILSLTHILGEAPPFTEVPRLPGTQEIDIPALVVACVRSFKPLVIWSAQESAKKNAYNLPNTTAPLEVIYQNQFYAALILAYPPASPLGKIEYEVTTPSGKRLDFIIIDQKKKHRIGIEFVASSSPGDIKDHAARNYPSGLQLDKYIVIHFSYISPGESGPYFSEGENKSGEGCQVPIYHITHDEEFKEVVLCHKEKEDDAQPTKTNILPPPGN